MCLPYEHKQSFHRSECTFEVSERFAAWVSIHIVSLSFRQQFHFSLLTGSHTFQCSYPLDNKLPNVFFSDMYVVALTEDIVWHVVGAIGWMNESYDLEWSYDLETPYNPTYLIFSPWKLSFGKEWFSCDLFLTCTYSSAGHTITFSVCQMNG